MHFFSLSKAINNYVILFQQTNFKSNEQSCIKADVTLSTVTRGYSGQRLKTEIRQK